MIRVDVTAPDDPRLADYVRLREASLRVSTEAEHGIFIAEGAKVVRRAVAAGHRVRSMLMAPRWLESLADVIEGAGPAPVYVAPDDVIEQVTGFHVHRGALASLYRAPVRSLDSVLEGARRVLVLEDLVDHTNVGAIFRTAAALGWDAVVLTPRCADPLYRRSVKVSMGAVFSVPYARLSSWRDAPARLIERGFDVLALTPAADAVDIDTVRPGDAVALLIGSEGPGLSTAWLRQATTRVAIPMARGVDSLNVAAATAVAAHVLRVK